MSSYIVNVDGGARGNPGPAGWGVIVRTPDGTVASELRGAIAHATNNVAEYSGLVAALEWCMAENASTVIIRSDSLLLVQQMRGVYKVKSEGLTLLHGQARLLASRMDHVTFEHVPRDANKDADRLANQAMDEAAALRA